MGFCLFLSGEEDFFLEFILCAGFLVFPMIVNIVMLVRIMKKEFERKIFQSWFDENSGLFASVVLISASNPAALKILFSIVFGMEKLCCPVMHETEYALKMSSLVTIFLENLPQITIQMFVVQRTGWNSLIIASFLGSTLTMVQSLLTLLFVYFAEGSRSYNVDDVTLDDWVEIEGDSSGAVLIGRIEERYEDTYDVSYLTQRGSTNDKEFSRTLSQMEFSKELEQRVPKSRIKRVIHLRERERLNMFMNSTRTNVALQMTKIVDKIRKSQTGIVLVDPGRAGTGLESPGLSSSDEDSEIRQPQGSTAKDVATAHEPIKDGKE